MALRIQSTTFSFAAALSFGVAAVCSAATHRVPSEYATINNALDASAFGDTVLVAPGTYTDWENRPGNISCAAFLVDGVVLRSEGGSSVTIIDMQHEGEGFVSVIRGIDLLSDATRVEGFTIRGVLQGAPAILVVDSGKLTIVGCRIEDVGVQVPGAGPSALRSRYSDIEVIDCSFENCSATGGGAIGQLAGSTTISGCEFIGCGIATVYLDGQTGNSPSATIVNSRFLANVSTAGALSISHHSGGVLLRGCRFEDNASLGPVGSGAAALIGTLSEPIAVEECVFINNRLTGNGGGGALAIGLLAGTVSVTGNTFYGSEVQNPFVGSAADFRGPFQLTFANNIIASSSPGPAVSILQGTMITSSCNVHWDNPGGNTVNFPLGATDRVIDPDFCDPENADLTLSPLSPCLPPNSLGCGLIGALGEGCGIVSIAPESWSLIKSKYR
jgi:hypothetical protein